MYLFVIVVSLDLIMRDVCKPVGYVMNSSL